VSQFTRNFLLGIASLIGLVGLLVLLLLFGELDAFIKPRYGLTIDTTNAVGLRAGSRIELNGVPIGEVSRVVTNDDPEWPVRIHALIDRHVVIPQDAELYAIASLLGGSASLELETSGVSRAPFLPSDGSAYLADVIGSQLIKELTDELDARMNPVVDAMQEFELLARNLNELLETPDLEGPGDSRNIRTAVLTLNEVLEDVHEALQLAKSWLGDEQLRADARRAVTNANTLIEQATATLDEFTELAARVKTDAGAVSQKLLAVSDELTLTLQEVRALAVKANSGEGTIAQLLNNADLYNALDDAAVRLERTLRDVKLLLKRINDDGLRAVY
jgi:ribosome-associated translation inhibitor RaiA